MSAKKSWDVERKSVAQAQVPARRAEPVRAREAARPKRQAVRREKAPKQKLAKPRPLAVVSKEPLKVRRARARRIFTIVVSVLGTILVGVLFYMCWMPALRISEVRAEGPNTEEVVKITQAALAGTHFFILPRNSLFLIPESDIRKRILDARPDIVAVSLHSNGLQGLRVVAIPRAPAFLWCGPSYDTRVESCFATDSDGMVFAPYTGAVPAASSTLLLRVYTPLTEDASDPIRAHVVNTQAIPNALRLAKALRTLGANIAELALRGDEADFYTVGGTRITYVIGREEATAALAASVFPTLSLNNGSVEYIDLRFESKVYLRRTGEVQ